MENKIEFDCLVAKQSEQSQVVSFVAEADHIDQIAQISRGKRDEEKQLVGFQRGQVANHIEEIHDYLNKNDAVLPNSIILAFVAALLCSMFALIINYSIRFLKNSFLSFLSSSLSLGYAFPGLILAVGIIQLLTFVDSLLITQSLGLILTGSILGLIIAYIIKSYAMASSTIDSSYQRISTYVDDVSKTLGITGWKMLFKIHFPLIKTGVLTSALLVISEVIKELPATLILRPFNFDTLAVSAYIYASEERMFEAAAPSIAIVMVGLLPIFFLSRMIRESRPGSSIW